MAERRYRATLSKGRSGWCLIFRHPVCKTPDGRGQLRVRRGLGTREKDQANRLVQQMNEILSDSTYWTPAAREKAEAKFEPQIVAGFYDYLTPDGRDGSAERNSFVRLPGREDGYATVQLVGTTGAGKTTVVRQMIGTNPKTERFPSISAAKTTICDIEVVFAEGPFRAAVSFIPRAQVRQYITECTIAAIAAYLESGPSSEAVRRFMEHSEQRFRLGYILGQLRPSTPPGEEDLLDDEEDAEAELEDTEVTTEDRAAFADRLHQFLNRIETLAVRSRDKIADAAQEFEIDLAKASARDRDILQELAEEQLLQDDDFHALVDEILDEVEARFDYVTSGTLERNRDEWPRLWTYETDDRDSFITSVNRFTSNYAPKFGRLLTPLVEGVRVAGPFVPAWDSDDLPRMVLLDGQGIGHTADSTSSISTGITKRFQLADVIMLVDSAAQPMQAGPVAVLQTLVASGHESKLAVVFTHFDEVTGDNLVRNADKQDHVTSSFYNAIQAIGKASGRDAETSLKRLIPDRLFFLSKIQNILPANARFTRNEFVRLAELASSSILPPPPTHYQPVYDVANLVLAIQNATMDFHDRWHGILGMGTRSGIAPEHWARVKALTRRIGLMDKDEYDNLRPIADLIRLMQMQMTRFLAEPLMWNPEPPADDKEAEKTQAIDEIRKRVFDRLHDLSKRRLIDERLSGWVEAYEHRGTGSTKVRAKDLVGLYESAAPVPNEMPGPDVNEFLFELRELVAQSVLEGGGELRGWTRSAELVE